MDSLEIPETSQNLTHLSKNYTLNLKYESLIVMRLMGVTHKKMGEKTGLSPEYVRRLFMKGGRLYQRYEEAKKVAVQLGGEEAMTILFSNLPDIARSMVISAKESGTPTGVMAGKIVFDHTFGKPVEKLLFKGEVTHSITDLVKRVTLRRKENKNDDPGTGRTISEGMGN